MKSKAYRAVSVNGVDVALLVKSRGDTAAHVGLDVGKESVLCVVRWGPNDFERPWKVKNPVEATRLAELLQQLSRGRRLVVALEPTGTYGDALRQALTAKDLVVHRVSPKMSSDYAEIFDGVPSQHDGKDAAVIAELSSQGRSWPWPTSTPSEMEQELAYWVDWMDGQRRQMMVWSGRLEALMSRHWPEATRLVKLCSGTLLECLHVYGGPRELSSAVDGLERVKSWGGHYLTDEKARALMESARTTAGVSMGRWDEERLRRFAGQVRECRAQIRTARRRLHELAQGHETLQSMGKIVGAATACVLWTELGAPKTYHCGAAYRKAMGLNLAERSSGKWQGKLKISKRGSSRVRRWLYLAALRWARREPVRNWYALQKAQRRGEGKPALVGVMRKLALSLYHVAGRGQTFDAQKLYRSVTSMT